MKAEAKDKCCSHLGLLTYLGGQVFLRHLFGLPTLGNQLPHIHINLWGNCTDILICKANQDCSDLPFILIRINFKKIFTFLWLSSSVSWSSFAVFKLVPFWNLTQVICATHWVVSKKLFIISWVFLPALYSAYIPYYAIHCYFFNNVTFQDYLSVPPCPIFCLSRHCHPLPAGQVHLRIDILWLFLTNSTVYHTHSLGS